MPNIIMCIIIIIIITIIIIIIIVIKKVAIARPGESDWHPISPNTSAQQYQPTGRNKTQWKTVEDKKGTSGVGQYKINAPALKTTISTPSNTGSAISCHRNTMRGIKVMQYYEFCSEKAHKYTDVQLKHRL